jgi:hypothetical protein
MTSVPGLVPDHRLLLPMSVHPAFPDERYIINPYQIVQRLQEKLLTSAPRFFSSIPGTALLIDLYSFLTKITEVTRDL